MLELTESALGLAQTSAVAHTEQVTTWPAAAIRAKHAWPPMLSRNDVMEQLSLAYMRATAALVRCSVEHTTVDRDSIDLVIHSRDHAGETYASPEIHVQLKAHAVDLLDDATQMPFDLPAKNYNDLVKRCLAPRILVVLCLPKTEKEWASCTPDALILRRCAFWHSLRGMPPTTNTKKQRIQILRTQVFDPAALSNLLAKISREEDLKP